MPQPEEAPLRAIWEKTADAVALSDPDGTVLMANPAYFALYGYGPDEVVGRNFAVIFPPEMRAWANERYQETFRDAGAPAPVETTVRRKDGAERVVEARVDFLTDPRGRRTAMLNVVRDVTDRRRAEDAARVAQARAEEALRARDELLATIAHDLQSPVTAIKGRAQLLRRLAGRADPTAFLEGLASIEGSIDQLSAQVGELLDLSRLQAGERIRLSRRTVDLVALARTVLAAHQPAVAPRPIELDVALPELLGQWDPVRLRRVLANLLINAAKYSPPDAPVVVRVRREDALDGAWAVLAVHDRGVGIPQADLARVFDPFHRAANVRDTTLGSGLGLASARHIVALHGGALEVESREGHGSTFTVRLPADPAAPRPDADR